MDFNPQHSHGRRTTNQNQQLPVAGQSQLPATVPNYENSSPENLQQGDMVQSLMQLRQQNQIPTSPNIQQPFVQQVSQSALQYQQIQQPRRMPNFHQQLTADQIHSLSNIQQNIQGYMTSSGPPDSVNLGQKRQRMADAGPNSMRNYLGQSVTQRNQIPTSPPSNVQQNHQMLHQSQAPVPQQLQHDDRIVSQEEASQRIKCLRDMYLRDLIDVFVQLGNLLQLQEQQPGNQELFEKRRRFKNRLEYIVDFLQISERDIRRCHRGKLDDIEKEIVSILSMKKSSAPSPQPQLPQPQIVDVEQPSNLVTEVDGAPPLEQPQLSQPQIVQVDQPVDLETDVDGARDVNASDSVPEPRIVDVDQPMNPVNEVDGAGDVNAADEDPRSKMTPIERLMKAVKSLPRASLAAAVADMRAVMRLGDTMAASAPGDGSRGAVGRDLAADSATFSGTKRMRREF